VSKLQSDQKDPGGRSGEVPAEHSRGRHNLRVVKRKRKMSNFPTESRSAAPARRLRYHERIVIVAPPEPAPP
jgi:hypothetical protein